MKKIIVASIILSCTAWYTLNAQLTSAANMESSRFRIQGGNINIGASSASSDGYDLSMTLGQTAAGKFTRDGYIIKAGFQYIHSIIPFTFSISNTNINLGTLTIASPTSTGTTKLKISFGGAAGYQVTAIEEGPLKTLSENNIEDTSCNSGSTCNEDTANPWTDASAYGFGYNVSCTDISDPPIPCYTAIPAAFKTCGGDDCPTYYRRFPDRTAPEQPRIVMSNSNVTIYTPTPTPDATNRNTHQTTVTFKANISPLQPAGSYQTVINFTAIPSF